MKALKRINTTYPLSKLPKLSSYTFKAGNLIGCSGSIFRRRVKGPIKFYWHYALFYGVNLEGELLFIENNKDGVECVTWNDFMLNEKWEVFHTEPDTSRFKEIIQRAKEKSKHVYEGDGNNCEHFVNYCIFGKHESIQADNTKRVADALLSIVEMKLLNSPGGDSPVLAEAINGFRDSIKLKRSVPKLGEKLDRKLNEIIKKGKNNEPT